MGEAATKDPSMEDILSSIRKIIAEEGSAHSTVPNDTPEVWESQLPSESLGQVIPEAMPSELVEEMETENIAVAEVAVELPSATPIEDMHQPRSLQDIANHVIQAETANSQTSESVTPDMANEINSVSETIHVQMEHAVAPSNSHAEVEAFRGALVSPGVDDAVAGSFDRLKRNVESDLGAKTEAALRPMLREWLDENLPTMVERLVREEIERVARGGV